MNKKVILITGSRKGIGKALAEHFLSSQDNLVIGCSRTRPDWVEEEKYKNYQHFLLDVADDVNVKKLFSVIRKNYEKLDYLINNAGIASMNHSILTPANVVETVMRTNVLGTFMFCREAAKLMKKNSFGRIINFSTVAVPLKLEGEAVYAASKAAIVSLTQTLAREYSEYGITVNAIGPTPIKTDLIKNVSVDKINRLINLQAIKRYGTYEDLINVIEFYIKKESGFVTGQTLYLGGV